MQTAKEVNPHPRIASCVNMWSATFFLFFFFIIIIRCHLLNVSACIYHIAWEGAKGSGPHQQRWEENESKLHSVTSYTNSIVSCIHVNTTKLRNITCTLVVTGVMLRTSECIYRSWKERHTTHEVAATKQASSLVRREGIIKREREGCRQSEVAAWKFQRGRHERDPFQSKVGVKKWVMVS